LRGKSRASRGRSSFTRGFARDPCKVQDGGVRRPGPSGGSPTDSTTSRQVRVGRAPHAGPSPREALPMINTVVVGYGLAGRVFHGPLIRRQPSLNLYGVVARQPDAREEACAAWSCQGFADLDDALADPNVDLVVIATPHATHAHLVVRSLQAGKHT